MSETERLQQYIRIHYKTKDEFAQYLGMTRQNVNHHIRRAEENGGELPPDFAAKLRKKGINIFHNDNITVVSEPLENASPLNLADKTIMHVPLVNKYAYAGYLSGYGDAEYVGSLPTIPMIADREGRGSYVAFEVKGDSMDDGTRNSYEQGDIVVARMVAQHHWQSKLHIAKYDFIIVHKTDGILLKKIVHHDTEAGTITLHSLNPLYDDFTIHLDDVSQIFNVIKVEREK
jgi:phage repressor protein C with HTH and peptisase S24 domain